jgi:hypothetical protein
MLEGGTSTTFSTQGGTIYNALKGNPNLFLILGGHLDIAARRSDVYNGVTVNTLRSDYQFVDGNQSGYLRIMRFSPANNTIYVNTFSPTQGKEYPDTTQNNFSLDYNMQQFAPIGIASGVASGGQALVSWPGLSANKTYLWYAVASDSTSQTNSPVWSFTTGTTTAVDLSSFTGLAQGGDIRLTWQTATEVNLLGFNLYRSDTLDGTRIKINGDEISAQNFGQMLGAAYDFSDSVPPGHQFYYWLQLEKTDGDRWEGPVALTSTYRMHIPVIVH